MHTPDTHQEVTSKKVRRGPEALTPEARKRAITDLEASFKGREWSDVLTEVLGRKDLEISTHKYDEISVLQAFPVTQEEAIGDISNEMKMDGKSMRDLEGPWPHSKRVYRHDEWVEEPMTVAEVVKEYTRLMKSHESKYERIERIKAGTEKPEPKTFAVARFPTKEILGDRDTEAYKAMGRKSKDIKDRFSKLFFKFQDISWEREKELQQGFLGIGNISQIVNKTKLDHSLGFLGRVRDRLDAEPLLDPERFIKAHILAAAGKSHDQALVEGFDPQHIEDAYQQYLKKYLEYEEALAPFDVKKEEKKSAGPYR